MKHILLAIFAIVLLGCQKDNSSDNTQADPGYPIPPPYGTGGCLFSGDHAFFSGQVIDGASGNPINNYKIQYHQGIAMHSDSVADESYLLRASEGYFYDGCSFTISIPDTIHIDLTDENGALHSLWFLSDTLVLGDTITMNLEL